MDNESYTELMSYSDIEPGERITLDIDGKPIVIFRVGNDLFALDDVCTHDQGPISEGRLEGFQIVCPRHGARFDVIDGKALNAPAFTNIKTYSIRNNNGMIEIKL